MWLWLAALPVVVQGWGVSLSVSVETPSPVFTTSRTLQDSCYVSSSSPVCASSVSEEYTLLAKRNIHAAGDDMDGASSLCAFAALDYLDCRKTLIKALFTDAFDINVLSDHSFELHLLDSHVGGYIEKILKSAAQGSVTGWQ